MTKSNNQRAYIALNTALIGVILLLISTRLGMGVGGDATIYIQSARNLLEGKGLGLYNPAGEFRLIPYFPPFFPLLIALLGKVLPDLTVAAKVIVALSSAVLLFCIGYWMAFKCHSILPGLFLGLFLAASPVILPAYSWAMSEPLSLALGFGGLICLDNYLNDNGGRSALIGAGVLAGLSFLTRYASAAFLVAGALMLFCFSRKSVRERFADSLAYSLIALIPMAVWLVIDLRSTQTVGSRSMQHSPLTTFLPKLGNVFSFWFVPESYIYAGHVPSAMLGVLSVLVIAFPICCLLFALKYRKKDHLFFFQKRAANMMILQSLFFLTYLLVIAGVAVFTYPPITINSRMLLPLYISFFWLIALLYEIFLKDCTMLWRKVLVGILLFAFCGLSIFRAVKIVNQNSLDGLGYNSAAWQNSETVAWLEENVDSEQLLVTNEETALLYLTGRVAWPMQEVYASMPDEDFYAYESSDGKIYPGRDAFLKGEALLVVFDTFEDQMKDIYGERTFERIDALLNGLDKKFDGDDGAVYALR